MTSTPDARALFSAARDDAPDSQQRDAMFGRLTVATGLAASTVVATTALSATPPAAATVATPTAVGAGTSIFGLKLLAVGAFLGAVSTALGVLVAVSIVPPDGAHSEGAGKRSGTADVGAEATPLRTRTVTTGARAAQPLARRRDVTSAAAPSASSASVAVTNPSRAPGLESDLAEEAGLVTSARAALLAGDASRALVLVQATRKLRARALEPEELVLEARALGALGRTDEAVATELVLRRRYPDHALAH